LVVHPEQVHDPSIKRKEKLYAPGAVDLEKKQSERRQEASEV
jgi:hypothetical protein